MDSTEIFEPVGFREVFAGDRIRFITTENGYGGRGIYTRTGMVVRTGPKSVVIHCEDGSTGRLRSADWNARSPHKARAAAECPSCAAPADETGCRIPKHRPGCPYTADYRVI